ncbi:hypothetical protein [Pseudomonas sp. 18175]
MQWTIKSVTPADLFEVCAVLVAGVVIQLLDVFFENEKTVAQPDWQPEE